MKLGALIILLTVNVVCLPAESPRAQNVILFIGDGMGLEAITAASLAQNGADPNNPGLTLEQLPYDGYVTTYAANALVTDSATAATAMACGIKTNNGAIGVNASGESIQTILEYAALTGRATGLVTSVPINHATPAAFGAHELSRNSYPAILDDLLTESRPQVLLGGSAQNVSANQALTQAASADYTTFDINNVDQLSGIRPGDQVFGIFDQDNDLHLAYRTQRQVASTEEPHLSELATAAVIALSDDPDGFFLMVEGGAIDWAAHAHDSANVIGETLEFDQAIRDVLTLLYNHDRLCQTLVLVTADHETGGLAIVGPTNRPLAEGQVPTISFATGGHTAAPVPIYAFGPGAYLVSGRHNNTEIYSLMKVVLARNLPTGLVMR